MDDLLSVAFPWVAFALILAFTIVFLSSRKKDK